MVRSFARRASGLLSLSLSACVGETASSPARAPAIASDSATSTEASLFAAHARLARDAFARDNGSLWGVSFANVPFVGVSKSGRMYASEDPHVEGFAKDDVGFWEGDVPKGLPIAETASEWAGRRWALVRIPVADSPEEAAAILVHESFHVVAPEILGGAKDDTARAGGGLLDETEGRVWLRLELRALATAAERENDGAALRQAARDAVSFRTKLESLASPDERRRERVLDTTEGMAEYTGLTLTRAPGARVSADIRKVESGDRGFVRLFPYARGPEYGRLLDTFRPGWRAEVRRGADLVDLLRAAVGEASDLDLAAARYGVTPLRAEEAERALSRKRKVAELQAHFVAGPTLRLKPQSANITFDPGGQTPLGADGTVMLNFEWKGENGARLSAPGGALVAPSWNTFRVPFAGAGLPDGVLSAPIDLHGDGWSLHLPRGWKIGTDGSSRTAEWPE